jgi:hypothetical protein
VLVDAAIDPATVDLFDPQWHADGPPHALLAQLRAEGSVRWNPLEDSNGCWTVLGHAEVAQTSRDCATFASHEGGVFLDPDQVAPLGFARNLLLYMDPPLGVVMDLLGVSDDDYEM